MWMQIYIYQQLKRGHESERVSEGIWENIEGGKGGKNDVVIILKVI